MRILIDIGHPAHVHYFKNFIRIMKSKGHEFLVTSRDKEITFDLLNKYNIEYVSRGKGSDNLLGKILYTFKADYIIYKLSKRWKPDILISFAAPYASHVSRLIGKPHVAITDTEHAKLGLLAFASFSKHILTPDCFNSDLGAKHIKFKSYIEFSYLHEKYFSPNLKIKSDLNLSENQKFVLFRYISWGASHDIGQKGISDEMKKKLISLFEAHHFKVFISSEGELKPFFEPYKINIAPDKMHDVINAADFFVGESGTMSNEAAILGTPAVFINTLNAGVFEDEEKYGLLYSFRNADQLMQKLIPLVEDKYLKEKHKERRKILIKDKIDTTAFLVWFVENYPASVTSANNYTEK